MLNGTFSLYDIADVEAWCSEIVNRSGLELRHHEREDLTTYLIESAWEISRKWDAGRTGGNFSGFCLHTLRLRVIDWQRSRYGRTLWVSESGTYERVRPHPLSLDDPLGPADPRLTVDASLDSDIDLRRILGAGSGPDSRRTSQVGKASTRRAA